MLQQEDVRGFIVTELTRVNSASHASAVTSALRAYFRYRSTCGDAVNALLGAISSPVRWSQASLPRALTTEEVQRLEAYCAQTKRAPLRLLAMVRLALDLGLRVGEIAKLEIGDFDWRAGTVTLKRTKSQRQDVLPLPALTGQALACRRRFKFEPVAQFSVGVNTRAHRAAAAAASGLGRPARQTRWRGCPATSERGAR